MVVAGMLVLRETARRGHRDEKQYAEPCESHTNARHVPQSGHACLLCVVEARPSPEREAILPPDHSATETSFADVGDLSQSVTYATARITRRSRINPRGLISINAGVAGKAHSRARTRVFWRRKSTTRAIRALPLG